MNRQKTFYNFYLASIYKWGMMTMVFSCLLEAILYTAMKLAGYYSDVSWRSLLIFDLMDIFYVVLGIFLAKTSVKNGFIRESRLLVGKIFAFFVLVAQWNYIIYMIPSRTFWGFFGFFTILICFFLDIKLIVLSGLSCLASLFLAWHIRGICPFYTNQDIYREDFIIFFLSILLCLFGIVIFVFFMVHVQWVYRQGEKQLALQQKFYRRLMEKDEGMQRFRHDVKNHMMAVAALCDAEDFDGVKKYIKDMAVSIQESSRIYTGNPIGDCFINAAVEALKQQGDLEYQVIGKFPEKLPLRDSDFCILLANALDNAREALEELQENRQLIIVIRNYRDRLFLTIKNTSKPRNKSGLPSTKKQEGHGYGLHNMKLAAKKYGGMVEWQYKEGMFSIEIQI